MSHTSRIFDRVPIDLPNRSGFDLSHQNGFTATCGTLTPALSYPLLPNETVSLGVDFQVQLPPMVTDFYGKVDAVCECFFVPNRLLWGGWESFITHPTKNPIYPEGTLVQGRPTRVPCINLNSVGSQQFDDDSIGALAPSSLADFLGIKQTIQQSYTVDRYISAMKFLAYHRIYDDWYRDTRIQSPLFYAPSYALSYANSYGPSCLPYVSITSVTDKTGPVLGVDSTARQGNLEFPDGISLMSLRQRNWSKGYFTTATLRPQGGSEATVEMTADDNGNSSFSIAQLRAANSLQKWNERNNFSYRYADQIYGQFGVYPDSARMDRVVFLGRVRQVVYNRSVMQSFNVDAERESPMISKLGYKGASSMALAEGSLINNFRATEHGYLFVIFSLVPHAYYSTGSDRDFERLESEDFPFPLLAGMGDQQIHRYELTGITSNVDEDMSVFGWNDLYAEYKYIEDQVHGLMRDGSSLENYMIQRSFSAFDPPELSSEFLRIPRTALDQVQSVNTSTQGFSCWTDMYFTFKKTSPLPAYSLPTLADMKNTHTGHMSRGGTSL